VLDDSNVEIEIPRELINDNEKDFIFVILLKFFTFLRQNTIS
jgi:hypothetical protein